GEVAPVSRLRPVFPGRQVLVGLAALALVLVSATGAAAQSTTTKPTTTKPATTKPTTTKPTRTKPAPTTSPPVSGAATRGVTDTSIKVGGIGDALLYGGADVGARARFTRANDAGGVNGRTIDYSGFTDDGGDPAAGSTAATNLVNQGAFAVVPAVTPDFA